MVNFLDEAYRQRAGWYAGITNDPEARLFVEHRVDEDGDHAWADCVDDSVAREAEKMLHDLGYEGGSGGGNEDSIYVYVYRITDDTCEDC